MKTLANSRGFLGVMSGAPGARAINKIMNGAEEYTSSSASSSANNITLLVLQ